MKKILSLTLAALLLVSMIPTAMAADTDVKNGTTIELVGSGSEAYTVTVPAELQPGQSGTVKANGTWASGKTLKVTAPNSVTVSYGEQTMPVGITFAGITLAGNDLAAVSASADVTVADATALFGTWTGTLSYNVVLE